MFEALGIVAVVTTPAITTVGYVAVKLGQDLHRLQQEKAVERLKETYEQVLSEPVPEDFLDLMEKLK